MNRNRTVADDLQQLRFLGHVDLKIIRTAAIFFNGFDLEPGEALWREGDPALELAVLIDGELLATNKGVEVGRVSPHEVVGEASVFVGEKLRGATLTALERSRVVTLQITGLRRLRERSSPVYDALLSEALSLMVRRIRSTDLRIARVALGDRPAPTRRESSMLARMWRALRPGGPKIDCPSLLPLLQDLPHLQTAPMEVLEALTALFHAQAVEEGQILCLEGEPGDTAYLVADGHVDVLRHVRGERAERLATLGPGDLFGVNSVVERSTRTASCVAAEPGWVYRISSEDFRQPSGEVARVWQESVLATLATQLKSANAVLNRVMDPLGEIGEDERTRFDSLMEASSLLESLPSIRTTDLERVDVLAE